MKKHFSQLILLIPLLFVAGVSMAAYSFTAPTAIPPAGNTDGPLDVSSTDQIKHGSLAVNAFQSQNGSDLTQQSSFAGLVNGGTSNDSNSTISFGSSATPTTINNIGNTAIAGTFQSDSLKTGGSSKPLCADDNGNFYICGGSPPPTTYPIYVSPQFETLNGGTYVVATLSTPIHQDMQVTIVAHAPITGGSAALNYIKNAFTAEAKFSGVCYPPYSNTVTIPHDSTTSNSIPLADGCNTGNVSLTISSFTPTTDGSDRKIVAN